MSSFLTFLNLFSVFALWLQWSVFSSKYPAVGFVILMTVVD
jgi:hypothetical protein